MLKVQEELAELRNRANEKELQAKQEQKIASLEQEIAKYRHDCESIMKYSGMQKQLLADYTLRKREYRDDQVYMETEVAQGKVDKLRLKISLAEEQNKCEAATFQTKQASLILEDKINTIRGGYTKTFESQIGSQEASLMLADGTMKSATFEEKEKSSIKNQNWSSQD